MGYILFGAPGIARFHLHQQLARTLTSRGHRVAVLAAERPEFDFYSEHALPVQALEPGRPRDTHVPIEVFAEQDCLLSGDSRPRLLRRQRAKRALARIVGPLTRLFEADPPDLVFLHQARSGRHRVLHYVAREFGCQVIHTGDGLLPGTMQWDGEGIDGESSSCQRTTRDYRHGRTDAAFLSAALASWLARYAPPPLSRTTITPPPLRRRLATALHCALQGGAGAAHRAIAAWSQAQPPRQQLASTAPIPRSPATVVLLQSEDSTRLRLDAGPDCSSVALALATLEAAAKFDPGMPVIGLLPQRGMEPSTQIQLRNRGMMLVPASTAPEALATAAAVTTVNHPLGLAALMTGAAVLHIGRTPYGVAGIATHTSVDRLANDFAAALEAPPHHLRERFLTRYLATDHVWCSADHPDHNGLSGLVSGMEAGLRAGPLSTGLNYRAGPVWPMEPVPQSRS